MHNEIHADPADRRAISRRGLTLALLTATYFFSFMDRQILAMLLEPIRRDLHLSDVQLGILSGLAFAIFYATCGVPVARLADRGNRRTIIAVSLIFWSIMTALCGAAQTFTQLLLARVGVGIGEAGSGPASQSIIADLYPVERRASAMSVYSLGVLLGGGLGMAIGGYIASIYGWRVAIVTVSMPGVALAVAIQFLAVEPRPGLSDHAAASLVKEPVIGLLPGFSQLWQTKPARHLVAALTVTSIIGYAASSWIPSYLQRSFGMSLTEVATYLALPISVIAASSAILGGWLCDRAARRSGVSAQARIVAILQVASLPFLIGFYALDDRVSALGCYFAAVLVGGTYIGPTYAMIQHLAPARLRATWAAITLLSVNLVGLGLGPLLVGNLSDVMRPTFGEDALRWSLFSLTLLTPLAVFHYWRAARLMSLTSVISPVISESMSAGE